ncbi:MAG: hypothetical protein NZ700_00940 [Gemmataceae bacterium]|nr:hypothetical protein [Gemmataceae bacterium]MDW8265782.1 hypothetical protein [Gemmataceae bacterium]
MGVGSDQRRPWLGLALVLAGVLSGCASPPQTPPSPPSTSHAAPASPLPDYVVACPDVLEWAVASRPEWTGRGAIRPDGRLDFGPLGMWRVEGKTIADIRRQLAAEAGVDERDVEIRVVEYRSQQVYIFGELNGPQRAIPYQGPETVRELLARAGGISEGAQPDDVRVVRTRVADGRQPEVFRVKLNEATDSASGGDLRLQPFDQIYIGERRTSCTKRCLPPWLRPIYQRVCDLPWPAWCRRRDRPEGEAPTPAGPTAPPASESLPPRRLP